MRELKEGGNLELYGKTLAYKHIFLGRINGETGEQWVKVEEFIDGEFTKYVNNTGIPCGMDYEIHQKCESLAHFSYGRSDKNIIVVDM